jgi:hypothetical protein
MLWPASPTGPQAASAPSFTRATAGGRISAALLWGLRQVHGLVDGLWLVWQLQTPPRTGRAQE